MAKKRFTFADAKEKIKDLEQALLDEQKKVKEFIDEKAQEVGNAILDTQDNVFTAKELKKIKYLEAWAPISLVIIIILGAALITSGNCM